MATNQMGLASKAKLTAIANAIRSKLGVSTQYSLDDMPSAIASISGGGGITPTGTINIAQNGTYNVTQYASVVVNVSSGGGGGGIDISPFKFVKGTLTPSEDTKALTFPCGDISTVVFCEAKVVNYESYISADNNGMGLGRVYYNFRLYFDNRTFNSSIGGLVLSVYNGAFDYWNAANIPTVNTTNQTATFAGNNNVTFKAGIPIEYVMWGV